MTPRELLDDAINSDTDECVLWPHAKDANGYARINHKGTNRCAMNLVLEATVGPRPLGLVAAHGPCHNRSCINPRHLRWATIAENARDRLRDGTHGRKLTPADIEIIRQRVAQGERQRVIARDFGISRSHVGNIITGHRWRAAS